MIEERLADLVHESARADATRRLRHKRFIASRMSMGALALASLPLYLAVRGVPTVLEYIAIGCLVLPLVAAAILSRTGRIDIAHVVSAAAFAGLIVCLAGATGGLRSAAAVWLVAVPLEALLSGSRRAAIGSTAVALLATIGIAALDASGLYSSADPWPSTLALPVFALTAIAHAGALVLSASREEGAMRDAVRQREVEDRTLLQVIDDLVTWHDRNGHVVKASPACVKLLGVGPQALAERGLLSRVHVQDRPAFLKAISDCALGTRPVSVQFRVQVGDVGAPGADGQPATIWVEMRAHRVESAGADSPHAVVAVTREITAHKRHEDELEQACLRAERADELKGRFLAIVSHELRTPLNAIIGFSEVLASESLDCFDAAQRRDYAKIIHDSGHHLLDVVNTLLDISKIETGNFDIAPEPFDAAALVHSCLDLMRLKAETSGLALSAEIEPNLPELVADRRACRQVLLNLISNAVKFTPGGGRVVVRLRRDGDRLVFAVSDTGVGVSEADLHRLGSPFFQAASASAYERRHEGTGLGLSVVRGLIGLHHGSLAIESAEGEGTCVTFELPLDGRSAIGPAPVAPIPIRTLPRGLQPAAKEEMRQRA